MVQSEQETSPFVIQSRWLFKEFFRNLFWWKYFLIFFILIVVTIALVTTGEELSFTWLLLIIVLVQLAIPFWINSLSLKNFRYEISPKFLTFHQGILSKQQRHLPYGVIQGVYIYRDIWDRVFGLASLTIEDASHQGRSKISVDGVVTTTGKSKRSYEVIGWQGNKIHIPGLLPQDAEAFKQLLLKKIKENPIEDSQSGL